MKKVTALGILITIALGFSSWVGSQIFNHEARLSKVETKEENMERSVKRIEKGVQYLIKLKIEEKNQ